MSFNFYVVDAFINPDKAFSGNPAAVVILNDDSDIPDERKQLIAVEFNLSDTVFVSKCKDASEDSFLIRWFTPTNEAELCGHATLAASYILFTVANVHSALIKTGEPIKYRSKYGAQLQVTFDGTYVTLNFPRNEPAPVDKSPWMEELKKATLGNGQSPELIVDAQLSKSTRYLLLRLDDKADISQVKPDCSRLLQVDSGKRVGIIVLTQKTDYKVSGTHFNTRVFAPWWGVDEDPVTGSAFTVLTPYWSKVYESEFNQKINTFYSLQTSKRSGLVRSQLLGTDRVLISGQARTFSSGIFSL